MELRGTIIEDTYAEAFDMWACRLIVTAVDGRWARAAAQEATGYGASIIGCDAEAGIDSVLDATQTPDRRAGVAMMFFTRSVDDLARAATNRVGQCVLTCPTTALFDGTPRDLLPTQTQRIPIGENISVFGDGFEQRAETHGRTCLRIPVMDGWFVVEASARAIPAVGGGQFLICAGDQARALQAACRAVDAIAHVPDAITPFPNGVVRSGSKVGAKTPNVGASTNESYCPPLREQVRSKLRDGVECVYEIVIDGLTRQAVEQAMRVGITAACGEGVTAITACDHGGRLGKIHLPLHKILKGKTDP